MTRLEYNIKIIDKLKELIIKNPDLRFGQILVNYNIIKTFEDDRGRTVAFDPFYTESKYTWEQICNKIIHLKNQNRNNMKNPVLGAICGDMIGVPYEWYCKQRLQIPKDFPLWSDNSRFSDDTVMTIAVAEWLLTLPFNKDNLIKIMQKWGRKYRNAGYGHLFGKWIDSDNPQPYNSFGNGSAMRVSPVGCAFHTLETTLAIAEESASVSHNHPEGIKGAQVIANMIFECRQGGDQFNWLANYYSPKQYQRTPEQIIKSGYKFDSTCQGSVPEAICCFLYSNSYEETIRFAVSLRGDADTQAAIAGSIAAAYWGIPREIAEEGLNRLPNDMYDILKEFSEKYNLDFI